MKSAGRKAASIGGSLAAGLFGLGLLAGLFFLTGDSFAALGKLAAHLNWAAFAGIVLCSFLYVVLGALKWQSISGVASPRPFFYTHFTAQAMLIGQFLPPPAAIALSRTAVMKLRQNTSIGKGLFNAVYDMGFDFLIAALLVPVSLLQYLYGFDFRVWLAIGCVILGGGGFLFVRMPAVLPAAWRAKLHLMGKGMLAPRLIRLMIFLSAARFALVIARLALGAIAIGVPVSFAIVAYAAPLSTMSSLLMLTPANLGIAEWSWTYLLTLWGIPASIGAFYGVGFRILVFAAQIIVSGVCYLLYKAKA